jgi:hypothetical protein
MDLRLRGGPVSSPEEDVVGAVRVERMVEIDEVDARRRDPPRRMSMLSP